MAIQQRLPKRYIDKEKLGDVLRALFGSQGQPYVLEAETDSYLITVPRELTQEEIKSVFYDEDKLARMEAELSDSSRESKSPSRGQAPQIYDFRTASSLHGDGASIDDDQSDSDDEPTSCLAQNQNKNKHALSLGVQPFEEDATSTADNFLSPLNDPSEFLSDFLAEQMHCDLGRPPPSDHVPHGPRAQHGHSTQFESSYRAPPPFRSNNSSSTTYPRTQRFNTNHLASVPAIIPGGEVLTSALDPAAKKRLAELEEQKRELQDQIDEKQKEKRKGLMEWDSKERESRRDGLTSDLAGVRASIVKRSLFWITKCRPVDESTSASLSDKHPLRQIALHQIVAFNLWNGPRFGINSKELAAVHRYEPLYPQSSLEDLHLWILMEFLVCQKMLHVVVENCNSLQATGLAGDYISALVLEPLVRTDRNNVVKLKRLVIEDLLDVVYSFAEVAPEIYDAWFRHRLHNAEFSRIQERFNTIIGNLELWDDDALTSLVGISLQQGRVPNKRVIENHTAYFSSWRGIIELLDLIVISYAYVHVDDISEEFSDIKDHRISLPTESLRWPGSPDNLPRLGPVQLQMLPLNCLARFLGDRDVLVFERASRGSPRSALYLSTDIKTFADVWGPVWQVHDPKYPGVIAKYNSGGGSIVRWKHDPTKHPGIRDDERLCHWIDGFEDMSSGIEDLVDGKLGFVQNAQLLIGAGTKQQLKWRRCRCSVDGMTQHLKDYNRLGFLMTSEGYRKVVSYQTSLVLGSHGAQFGINRTVEDKKGTPLKISILERWENDPSSRKPQKFQNYWSVAISLCNMNAERVRLVRVLGSESVLALLGNFEWSDLDGHNSDGVRESYIFASYKKAVRNEDPKALGHLWDSNPAWRKDIGDAILVCLRVLARTGYREEYNQFYALWLPRNCSEPRRVMLELKDQNWIPFLKDTTNTMTTAVIVEDSFGRCSKDKKPSSWFKEPSVLETAICVNQSISPHGRLRKYRSQPREGRQIQMLAAKHNKVWSSMWDVTQLPEKTSFQMNTQVRVQVQRQIGRWQLLLEVESSMMSNLSRKIRGSNQPSHWEYTDEEGETSEFQPIPVAIKGGISWTSMFKNLE